MRRYATPLFAFAMLAGALTASVLPEGAAIAQSEGKERRGQDAGNNQRAQALRSQPTRRQSERRDQESARAELRAGRQLESREIERRVVPQMRGHEYIGFEFDGAAQVYRLKFMDEGRMVWVDVDAQTARVIRVRR